MKLNIKKRTKKIFIALLTILIMLFVLKQINIKELWAIILLSNKTLLISSTIVTLAIVPIIYTERWKYTLQILGYNATFKQLFPLFLANLPLSKTSPANAGDFVKIYYLKDHVTPSTHAGGILLERLLDLLLLSFLAMIFGLILNIKISFIIGIIIFIILSTLLISANHIHFNSDRPIFKKIKNILTVFKNYKKYPVQSIKIIVLTFCAWSIILLYIKLLFLAFGQNIPYTQVMAIQPIAIFFGLLPITLAGIGTREIAMLSLYAGIVPNPIIIAAGITYSFFSSVLLPLIGIPSMIKNNIAIIDK